MTPTADPAEIRDRIARIETEHDVEVLLAVEYGSRAWGLEGPWSDHDIRFVFKDRPERAFSLFDQRDVISVQDEADHPDGPIPVEFVGWSIQKALRLGVGSNPQLNEYIRSPRMYRADPTFLSDVEALAAAASPRVMAHYYRGNGKKTLLSQICDTPDTSIKANIQMVRCFMKSVWLVQNPGVGNFPPIDFHDLSRAVDFGSRRAAIGKTLADIDALADLKRAGTGPGRATFGMLEQWGLGEMRELDRDVMDLPDTHVDAEIAEAAFRHQYPETFPSDREDLAPAF